MRKYVRHPTEIPVEYNITGETDIQLKSAKNIALGGMCFASSACEENGKILNISIPSINPEFHIKGKVVWCLQQRDSVEIGVQFIDTADAFRARLVEQICHIKHYQKKVLQLEGRQLSDKQAALEWIEKHAGEF